MSEDLVERIHCRRCGMDKIPHKDEKHLCDDCVKAENSRYSYYRQHNFNWMDVAKQADIHLWDRQPVETDREWQVWLKYRDTYPASKPSYRSVATELGTTIGIVQRVGQRWSFSARMQAWARHCDELTMATRRQEILDMNKEHIEMAVVLRNKLKRAIDKINPDMLEPKDIQGLFKLVTDIERKARLDEPIAPVVRLEDDNPELKKAPTKTEDLATILQILGKTNVFSNVGVRQTTTTEIIMKDGSDD